jgi:D-alanyl-D-alanine-carboxypeptidase/D-alanyl-D-alanine-endopeptidase
MKKITSFLVLLLVSLVVNAQDLTIPQNLKDHLKARVDNDYNVGIVVAIINGYNVEYFNYGKTAITNGTDVDQNSVFEIGSISKVFTTIILEDKIIKGELSLDDPISKYLPDTLIVPSSNDEVITLRHLATHTSGLPRMPSNFAPKDMSNPFADYTNEKLYAFLSGYQITSIGTKSEYSNLGMGLLGHILELQSGKTFEELVVETIAKPLKMDYTAVTISESMATNLAKGHAGSTEVANWDFKSMAGAGGLKSNANGMVKFIQANMGVLDSDLYNAMQLTHQSAFKDASNDFEIGLAWHYEDDNKIIWHNGQTGGYHSFAGFIKGTDKGVVILTNTAENVGAVGFNILGISKTLRDIKVTLIIAPEILETYAGKYELAPGVILQVITKDGHLFAQLSGQSQFELHASGENSFYYKVVKATVEFNTNDNGTIDSLTLLQNGQILPGKKIE